MKTLSTNEHPNYYRFPGGIQALHLSRHLTGNGCAAVNYIARATRIDGLYKHDRAEDLRKAIVHLEDEIARLEDENNAEVQPSN